MMCLSCDCADAIEGVGFFFFSINPLCHSRALARSSGVLANDAGLLRTHSPSEKKNSLHSAPSAP